MYLHSVSWKCSASKNSLQRWARAHFQIIAVHVHLRFSYYDTDHLSESFGSGILLPRGNKSIILLLGPTVLFFDNLFGFNLNTLHRFYYFQILSFVLLSSFCNRLMKFIVSREDIYESDDSNVKGLLCKIWKYYILILFFKQHATFSEGMKLLTLESHISIDGTYEIQWLVKLQWAFNSHHVWGRMTSMKC